VIDAEELTQFKQLTASLFFRGSLQKVRVEQPKLFERIFLIPVDPDDFVIDEKATRSTRAGKRLLNSDQFRACVVEERDDRGNSILKLGPRNEEFSEFFSVVVLGVDL